MPVNGAGTVIKMDGRKLDGVRSVRVETSYDGVSTVTLEFVATASIDGEAQVWIKDRTQALENRAAAAEDRADEAQIRAHDAEGRATDAEDRATASEARTSIDTSAGTLAYIVPVNPPTPDDGGKP